MLKNIDIRLRPFANALASSLFLVALGGVSLLAPQVGAAQTSYALDGWGTNGFGELGNGTVNDSSPSPVQMSGLTGVVAVASGAYHNLALQADGTVMAVGFNAYGQLGDNTITDRHVPVQVITSSEVILTDVIAIAAGEGFSLALRSNGTVWAWGWNGAGMLGNNSTASSSVAVQVTTSPGVNLTGVIAIASGANHALALRSDGTVWTWGYNNHGQLGNNSTTNSSVAVQVTGLSGVTAIAGGEFHSLACLSNGSVMAWGFNGYGQLGNNSTADSLVPVAVSGLSDVSSVVCGYDHNLALKSDGTIIAWGWNDHGQLGNGTIADSRVPVPVTGLDRVTAIACGDYHSLARRSDGTIWTWGWNAYGALGNGTTADGHAPAQVPGLSRVIAIAGGGFGSLAVVGNPPVPSSLTAAAGIAQVNLSWAASSNATSYNVKQATISGGPYTTIATPAATSYSNTGLTAGMTYYYVVSAVNGGESGNSSEVHATPYQSIPSLTSISPNSATLGDGGTTATITGSNFQSGAIVQWNGTAVSTTFVSSTQLTAALPAADFTVPGLFNITVLNPDGGLSGTAAFTVNNPTPLIASISPASASACVAPFILTIAGTNFVSGATVKWNGAALATAFVSATKLTAIALGTSTTAGPFNIVVDNPSPEVSTSNAKPFTVTGNSLPVLNSISPTSVTARVGFTLTVSGYSFTPCSTIVWNGSALATTFSSINNLTAIVPASVNGATGPVNIQVVTPAPGGGASVTNTLTVVAPVLALMAISPTSVAGGFGATGTVTLTGPAPPSGVTINLGSNNLGAASVGPNVTVPDGQKTATFPITTAIVPSQVVVTITATQGAIQYTGTLTVRPILPTMVTLSPAGVYGGAGSSGTVTINSPAPSGGITVILGTNNSVVTDPDTNVLIPAAATSATFAIATFPVSVSTPVTISAAFNGATKTAALTVKPPVLATALLASATATGGTGTTLTLTLTSPAPAGGTTVTLTSSKPSAAAIQANVVIPSGSTSATVNVTTSAVTMNTAVTLTATGGGVMKTQTLTVTP